jgi:pimeloyl-ACP methyl ester carboxylesterase
MRRLAIAIFCLLGLAGLSACAKPELPWAQLESRYGNTASRYLDLPGGVRVHYRDQGSRTGRTVVLVHGFAASLHAWEPWVQRLAPDYRVITLDLAGHGLTRTPAGYQISTEGQLAIVDAVTRNLGVERFVLGGNSMGGAVAWNYALAHPDRLQGLVLVDAAGWPVEGKREGSPLAFKLLANPVGRAVLKSIDLRDITERGLKTAYVDETLVNDALISRYVDLAMAPGRRELILNGQSRPRQPVTKATFAKIAAPTLVMTGEADKVIPAEASRGLAGAIPGAKLITYPGVGHVPMEQVPERSAQDVKAFLASLPPI